jgi:hypothetical protein
LPSLQKFWNGFYSAWKFMVSEYEVIIILAAVIVAVLWLFGGNQ